MFKVRWSKFLAASAAAVSMSAMAAEPSQAEIEKALRLMIAEANVDERILPTIHSVKKLAINAQPLEKVKSVQ